MKASTDERGKVHNKLKGSSEMNIHAYARREGLEVLTPSISEHDQLPDPGF